VRIERERAGRVLAAWSAALGLMLALAPLPVRAEPAPAADGGTACQVCAPSAEQLAQVAPLQLADYASRRSAGFWLFGFGVLSVAGGAAAAGFGHADRAWLAAGITTASFGAINALLALGLLDLSGARLHAIQTQRVAGAASFARIREAEISASLKAGQLFALNAGLDVFYAASGALLYVIGRVRSRAIGWEEGAGLAMITQSVFLLAFDVINWIGANRRAELWRSLAAP
jgi:hypothetical protein